MADAGGCVYASVSGSCADAYVQYMLGAQGNVARGGMGVGPSETLGGGGFETAGGSIKRVDNWLHRSHFRCKRVGRTSIRTILTLKRDRLEGL